jgi:hypothetical protein
VTGFSRFLPIAKVDRAERMVWGYASTPALDMDGEVVKLSAIKAALPDYLAWSNIREMHQPSAVGVAREATVDDRGLWLGAHIVDEPAWQKVLAGVYKGFSIGGSIVRKVGKFIEELTLVEISIVDRPANPECRIEVVKSAAPAGAGASLVPASVVARMLDDGGHAAELGRAYAEVLRVAAKAGGVVSSMSDPSLPSHAHEHTEHGLMPSVPAELPASAAPPNPPLPVLSEHLVSLDTEEQIREAWGRLVAADAASRSPEDLSADRERISDAWRRVIDPSGPPSWGGTTGKVAGLDLSKSLFDVSRLVAAFESLRTFQRSRSAEGVAEGGDEGDAAAAQRAGEIAREIAALAQLVLGHESEESVGMTDADDDQFRMWNGALEMEADKMAGSSQEDLAKRASAMSKEALGRAMEHLGKAAACGKGALTCVRALGDMHREVATAAKSLVAAGEDAVAKAAAVDALRKAADGFSHATALDSVHKALGHLGALGDHHEIAQHNIGKALGVDAPGYSHHIEPAPVDPAAPAYSADSPYSGKGASGVYTKEAHEAILAAATKAARLEGELEALRRLPASPNRARLFEVGKAAGVPEQSGATRPLELLMDGVSADASDPDQMARAAGRMIGNMIRRPDVFGKSLSDPAFRGLAG